MVLVLSTALKTALERVLDVGIVAIGTSMRVKIARYYLHNSTGPSNVDKSAMFVSFCLLFFVFGAKDSQVPDIHVYGVIIGLPCLTISHTLACVGDMIQHQCRRCLKQDHAAAFCPYKNYVPKGAKVGPGYMIVCKCCREEGGHDDENWVGLAVPRRCWNCRSSGEHSTKDCPKERASVGTGTQAQE